MRRMNIDCIIQARIGSTRLPGKVLKEIEGKPLIYYVLDQVNKSKLINRQIVASTTNPKDKILIEKVKQLKYNTFAGSENDVLDRYYQTAKYFGTNIIVRVTSDCPLIDPEVIDKVIKVFLNNKSDYCSNVQPPTYPDGLDVEVFSFQALARAWKEAHLMSEREHVTPYIWKNTDKFKISNVAYDKDLSYLRLTVDQEEDFILVKNIYEKIKKRPILLNDLIKLFGKEPELLKINSKYSRNEGYAKSLKEDKIINKN